MEGIIKEENVYSIRLWFLFLNIAVLIGYGAIVFFTTWPVLTYYGLRIAVGLAIGNIVLHFILNTVVEKRPEFVLEFTAFLNAVYIFFLVDYFGGPEGFFFPLIYLFILGSFFFLIPVAIIAAIGAYYFKVIDIEGIASEYLKLEEKKNQFERRYDLSQSELSVLATQENAILGGLSVLEKISNRPEDYADEKIALKAIIDTLFLLKEEALGFKNGGIYNFMVYRYDKKEDILYGVYRDVDRRIVPHDRKWKIGEGHVGFAFTQPEPVITSDIADIRRIKARGEKYFSTDDTYYQSFISAPIIGNAKNIKDRIGVFVITSSVSGQFNSNHKTLANCYTILINMFRRRQTKTHLSKQEIVWGRFSVF